GWNRKSLRLTVPILGTDKARLAAVDALVHLAAKQWADRLAAAQAAAAPVAGVPQAAKAAVAVAPPARSPKSTGNKKRSA
ncbi:MAG TPA: hypothetical protein VGI81_03545, partial [Tepidisphaeraceae bacterium]